MTDGLARMEALIADLDGTAGVCVRDAHGNLRFDHNAGLLFPAASLIKLPIYFTYLDRVRQGRLDPERPQTIPRDVIVGGSGILQSAPPGAVHTLNRIAGLMLTASDNTAANLLIDRLGMASINAAAQSLGMTDTLLRRRMMDEAARAAGEDNVTTPRDMMIFLGGLLRPAAMDPGMAQKILSVLRRQELNAKLPDLLPPSVVVAHKTGELDGIEHDAGLVFAGRNTGIVAVLTRDLKRNADGVSFCRTVGRMVYEALVGAPV